MIRFRLAFAGLLALALCSPAAAQQARVVTDCTLGATLPARDATALMVDQTGKLCTASTGGGSTGSVTAPGTSGAQAQAVQGINGGVPVAIQGGNAAAVKTDGSGVTQPVSATALPLPAGAASSANQASEIAALGATSDAAGANSIIGQIKQANINLLAPISDGPVITLTGNTASPLSNGTYTDGAIPTSGYGSISLDGTAAVTAIYEYSNDKIAWSVAYGNANAGTNNAAGSYAYYDGGTVARTFPLYGAYFRVRASGAGGTSTIRVQLKAAPFVAANVSVTQNTGLGPWQISGTTTVRAAGTNRSASVGTTAVVLMAANTGRQGWKIKNDSSSDIWINFDATATAAAGSGNIRVPAGGYLASEPGFVETGAMSVVGSAANLAITAREH